MCKKNLEFKFKEINVIKDIDVINYTVDGKKGISHLEKDFKNFFKFYNIGLALAEGSNSEIRVTREKDVYGGNIVLEGTDKSIIDGVFSSNVYRNYFVPCFNTDKNGDYCSVNIKNRSYRIYVPNGIGKLSFLQGVKQE